METIEEYELLFFDTFSQTDGHEGPNLGLVQFPNPIIIKEIRVIPLGARVEADFPGGVRLGATNPSSFCLEFFINDLTRSDSCTFLDIGSLDFKQNLNIKFVPKESIPTDGLIIRGMYSTLTLSVFGCIADISSIIAQDSIQTSSAVSEEIQLKEESIDLIDESKPKRMESLSIGESIAERIDESIKMTQIIQNFTEIIDESNKKRCSPTYPRKNESRESRASSLGSDKSDRKRKDKTNEVIPLSRPLRPRERIHRNRRSRSPMASMASKRKSRSRSKTKSKSRSTTPNSTKRYRYSHRTPSSPFEKTDRSPKRLQRSPRRPRSRSPSPRSPHYANKTISRSPLSPPSLPPSRPLSRSRNRSPTKSPVFAIRNSIESNDLLETTKPEIKLIDDSELFDPLSPEDSLSEMAEKISDDENLDQIIGEEENQSKDGFEVISSEEEYEDDGTVDNDLLMDYSDYELSAYADLGAFNPFQCEFTSLQTLKDPSLSVYQLCETEDSFDSEIQSKIIESINSVENERTDKWVEAVEQIALELNRISIKSEYIIKTLIEFIADGIDFDLAVRQLNTAYKVRHLKAGIKLLIAMAQTSDPILIKILDLNVTQTLLQLYSRPFMTIPVRLLILRGIDVICDSSAGVQHLFNRKYLWYCEGSAPLEQTCYQRLLDILVDKPSTRLMVSLTSLLKKIHLFEVLKFVSKQTDGSNPESCNEDSMTVCLNEISSTYKNANNQLSQPLRSLPATKQFEVKTSPFDSYKGIYKYFRNTGLTETLINIISGKTRCSSDSFDSAFDLLNSMSNFSHGLRYLLSSDSINSTNNLYKVLIQLCEDSESPVQTIGLKLIYRLQVLQLVDLIFTFHSTQDKSQTVKDNFDDPDLVVSLHSLYTMLFTGVGRDAVVHVLSSENNLDSILPFICLNEEKRKEALIPKSVSYACALDLCLVTLQLIDVNLLNFLDSYGQILLKVCENDSIPKLESLSKWLSPIRNLTYNVFNDNTFKILMSFVKKHYELIRDSTDSPLFTISPDLITALRILQNLCAPTELSSSEAEIQLKHRYALLEIFSAEGLSQIVFLLNKMCETYLKPSHQSVALIGTQGSLVVNFVKPSVLIIKSIITSLVSSRGTEFKDVSPIPVLLRVYSVMALVPSTAPTQLLTASIAQQIQYEISEILLIYTELYVSSTETDEAVNKSVWTKMAKHLIDYTLSSPLTFIHGLSLLSDVLPQPLPLIVKHPMLTHEVVKTVNFRKLWSLHLHVLNENIDSLVSNLITSNSQPIQLLLRRVCAQLCDMSALTVNIVSKSVFDSFLLSLDSFTYSSNDSQNVVICPTVRILSLIQDLSANTPFRLSFVTLLGNAIKNEAKNVSTLSRLQSVLNKTIQMNSINESLNFILQPNSDSDVVTSESMNGNTTEANKPESNANESLVLSTECLSDYFTNRPVFVLEDDRLVPEWVLVANDDSEQFDCSDALKINLLDISMKYFGNECDFRSELEKLWTEPLTETQNKDNNSSEKTFSLPLIRSGFKESFAINKRIQAPRGRGRTFGRGVDMFRSRPPNTSRPPSMHVDDFVALERNDSNSKQRVNKEFIRPNRGMNASLRSFGSNQRSSNSYRSSPSNARPFNDRYNQRENLSANRVNKSDANLPLRWNRINANRYDIRYQQYSRSFPR